MKDLFVAAQELQVFLEHQSWSFCFIGGLALQRWGEPRLTNDIDLTILAGFGSEEKFVDTLLSAFEARRPDAKEFALMYRVLLLQTSERIGIDVSLAAMPFEEVLIERATDYEFLPGCSLRVCSAEDLIVLKAFADRAQDWIDIRGILVRQGEALDRQAVLTRLEPLVRLKEEPEILSKLREMFTVL